MIDKINTFNGAKLPRNFPEQNFYWPENKTLEIEIGCGVGMHPINYSKNHPDRYLVAIEHTKEKFRKFRNSLIEENPTDNLIAVHANAISWIYYLVPEGVVDKYFILFPNPWPKKKQSNQRWHKMPFMSHLIKTLKPEGQIQIVTNEGFYAAELKDYMLNYWRLQPQGEIKLNHRVTPGHRPRTHFEKKYFETGQTIYDFTWKKSTL